MLTPLTPEQEHEQWLQARKKGIGGSDIAAIMGQNPYKTPYELWLEKTGRAESDPDNAAMYWGRVLEDVVADEFVERTGKKIARRKMVQKDFVIANVDRVIQKESAILECKTARQRTEQWGEEWTDQVPPNYLLQCQWYLMALERQTCYLAVLFLAERRFHIYQIEASERLQQSMWDAAADFWTLYVQRDMPPDPSYGDEVEKRYPQDNQKMLLATDESMLIVNDLRTIQAEIKRLQESEKVLKDELKMLIGEHSGIEDADGKPIVTWKASKPTAKVQWESLARDLKIKPSTIEQYTLTKPGSRRMLIK